MAIRILAECRFSISLSSCIALGYGSSEVTELTMGKFTQSAFYSSLWHQEDGCHT